MLTPLHTSAEVLRRDGAGASACCRKGRRAKMVAGLLRRLRTMSPGAPHEHKDNNDVMLI